MTGMVFSQNLKVKLLPILVNRAAIFFFVMSLLTLFLYVIGTSQSFVDTTQLGLLRLYSILAVFLATTSICGVILNIARFLSQRKVRYLLRAASYLLLVIFALATLLAVMFIFTLASGN